MVTTGHGILTATGKCLLPGAKEKPQVGGQVGGGCCHLPEVTGMGGALLT